MYRKTIICLANSYKHGGFCIAGKELVASKAGSWIRPVSPRPGHEVSLAEMRYPDQTTVGVLDIAEVTLAGRATLPHQPENHVLKSGSAWRRIGRASWATVLAAQDVPDDRFWGGAHDSTHGLADKLKIEEAEALGSSLKLVRAADLNFHVQLEPGYAQQPATRKVRLEFNYMGENLLLAVTDPRARDHFLAGEDGVYPCREALVCVSLSEVLSGYVYRLAATIITPTRCESAK